MHHIHCHVHSVNLIPCGTNGKTDQPLQKKAGGWAHTWTTPPQGKTLHLHSIEVEQTRKSQQKLQKERRFSASFVPGEIPMPVVASANQQAWVRVPPPKNRRRVKIDPVQAFSGPLSYFACRPSEAHEHTRALKAIPPNRPPDRRRVVSDSSGLQRNTPATGHHHRRARGKTTYNDESGDEVEERVAVVVVEKDVAARRTGNNRHQHYQTAPKPRPRVTSGNFQSAIFQHRTNTSSRNYASNNNRGTSSTWSSATKPLDFG